MMIRHHLDGEQEKIWTFVHSGLLSVASRENKAAHAQKNAMVSLDPAVSSRISPRCHPPREKRRHLFSKTSAFACAVWCNVIQMRFCPLTLEPKPTYLTLNSTQKSKTKSFLIYAKGHSAQPGMFWRTHHTKPDPISVRVMPLCLWGV